ncbi:hypothetical protein ABT030_47765 [Streptomyces mirabilis]|uniref:hypothetical protein n=1 Tax=Streptomyces mirabilis TaxID=68239 RepID=UPI00331F02F8
MLGLDHDLDEAPRNAVRDALTLLAYLSAAADFHISQVVDTVKGVHGRIPKTDLMC